MGILENARFVFGPTFGFKLTLNLLIKNVPTKNNLTFLRFNRFQSYVTMFYDVLYSYFFDCKGTL